MAAARRLSSTTSVQQKLADDDTHATGHSELQMSDGCIKVCLMTTVCRHCLTGTVYRGVKMSALLTC